MLELDGTGPLYHQVYRAFRKDILSRALRPGERVPSTRALADLLKVSRNTAVLAYEQLLAEGYMRHARVRLAQSSHLSCPRAHVTSFPRNPIVRNIPPIALALGLLLQERDS